MIDAWRVSRSEERALVEALEVEGDGVADTQAQSIAKLDFLIAFLKEQGGKALTQAEAGADPLVKMRDEVDRLLEAMAAIEAEIQQLQNERVRWDLLSARACSLSLA